MSAMPDLRLSNVAVAAAPILFVLLWSTGFIGTRFGLPYIEPMTFLAVRFTAVVALMAIIAIVSGAPLLSRADIGHSFVSGLLVHGVYLGGVFLAIAQGVPAGISALIPGLQPILTSTIANRFMGEKVTVQQWIGLVLGLGGVALVLHDRQMLAEASVLGWIASVVSLIGITLGSLYQKRFSGGIDWRSGNTIQYLGVAVVFWIIAFAFETRVIHWSVELVAALAWLAVVLSIATIGLMYWLIRRSAATRFASLFYLVPATTALMAYLLFGEKLDALSIVGMVVCAAGVLIVNRVGPAKPAATTSVK